MFSLKAELYKKQQEYGTKNETVPDTIRKQHKLKSSASSVSETTSYKKNPGVDARNEKDVLETTEEENKEAKVEAVLKAKAKLYDKMTSGDVIPSEESSSVFLVDFEQKSVEAWRSKHENEMEKDKKPELNVDIATEIKKSLAEADNEWVEHVDALGRTRRVRKKDLPSLKKIDKKLNDGKTPQAEGTGIAGKTLLSQDMRREAAREEWEKQAMEEVNGDLHYENLRQGENRELGVGYYSFSTDQETRDAQMKMLIKMREDTKKEKENLKEMQKKKRTALQARLEKVRERKIKKLKAQGKEIPNELLQPIQLQPEENPDEDENNVQTEVEKKTLDEDLDTLKSMKVREWDKGKDWVPAAPERPPKSWKDPREERPNEFAPPSFYYKNDKKKNKGGKSEASQYQSDRPSPGIEETGPKTDNSMSNSHQEENTVKESLTKPSSGNEGSFLNDVELRTNRILNFLEKTGGESAITTATDEVPTETASEYKPSASDKPFSIKIKPLSSKTKTLLTKSALDDAS